MTVHNNSHTWLLYNVSKTESYELGIHFCLERPVYSDSSVVPRGYPNRHACQAKGNMSNDILAKVFTSEHLNKILFAKEPIGNVKYIDRRTYFRNFQLCTI